MLQQFKYLLTRIGARSSDRQLEQVQATVNYLKIGRWMKSRGFELIPRVRTREDVWDSVAKRISNRRLLYLEFGVADGASIAYWSNRVTRRDAIFHGFDSFEGLPEDGGPWKKGQFDRKGETPLFSDSRVQFFKGWFNDSLPAYSPPAHDVLVINMDADLYSSTIYVLRQLRPFMRAGTFIYFDEMNRVEHEPRAFDDFVKESGVRFWPVCADRTLAFVSFECLGQCTSG